MKTTQDGKKRKQRPVDAGKQDHDYEQEQDDGAIRIRSKSKKKSKKKKDAKKQKTSNEGSANANGYSKASKVVTKVPSSMPLMDSIFGGSHTTSSIPLMDSIFGGSISSSDDRTKNTAIGTKASSSLLDSIFDDGNSISTSTKKAPAATMSLFDNPKIMTATPNHNRQPVPRNQGTPQKAKSAALAATGTNCNKDGAETIRRTLRNRTFRSQNRPLLRKALDFPGVFTNEEEDEENGYFLLDDENERTKEMADAVRDHGFCVLRNVIDTDTDNSNNNDDDSSGNGNAPHPLRDVVLPVVKTLQRRLNKALNTRGIHYSTDTFRFREGASRCKGRTDVVFDAFQKDEKTMIDAKQAILRNPKLFPVIQNLLGGTTSSGDDDDDVKLVYAGLIFSYPGSCDQPWHQDGMPLFPEFKQSALLQSTLPPYALNVFLPLEDEDGSTEKGPTELLPGSHKWTSPDERLKSIVENINDEEDEESDTRDASGSSDDDGDIIRDGKSIIAPVLKQGDALIYDYRVCHRGTANLFGKLEAATNHSEPSNTNADAMYARKKQGKKKKAKKEIEIDIGGTRRILYLMYARPWFTDHVNFDYRKNAKSLWDDDRTSADKK
jgi:ectoine hydroxylase-related dioxygenase (phytanoyl-CoA dioxygenase family)